MMIAKKIINSSKILSGGEIISFYSPKSASLSSAEIAKVRVGRQIYCLRISRGNANFVREKENIEYVKRHGFGQKVNV